MTRPLLYVVKPRRVRRKFGPPATDEDVRAAGNNLSWGRTEAQERRWWLREMTRAIALAARRRKRAPKAPSESEEPS